MCFVSKRCAQNARTCGSPFGTTFGAKGTPRDPEVAPQPLSLQNDTAMATRKGPKKAREAKNTKWATFGTNFGTKKGTPKATNPPK